jgi:hypothetical protein
VTQKAAKLGKLVGLILLALKRLVTKQFLLALAALVGNLLQHIKQCEYCKC